MESKRKVSKELMNKRQKWYMNVFNLIIKQDPMTPSSWKKVTEKETRRNHKNYRPSCSFPILYKLILHDALQQTHAKRDSYQFPEQAGSRGNSRRQIILWRTDLMHQKAEHGKLTCGWWRLSSRSRSIRYSMMQCGDLSDTFLSDEQYICLLKKLYADQRATVLTDWNKARWSCEQPSFQLGSSISHGERHWDLERKGLGHQIGWRKKRLHIQLAFCCWRAYDGELFETDQKGWLRTSKNTEAQGLDIHPEKSNISPISNQRDWKKSRSTGCMSKCFQPKEKSNIWGRWSHSWIKQLPRCSAESAVPGPRSPDIDRNWHRSLALSDTSLTLLSHRQQCTVAGHMDYNKGTRTKDPHNTAQNASSHHSDKEKRQKDKPKRLRWKRPSRWRNEWRHRRRQHKRWRLPRSQYLIREWYRKHIKPRRGIRRLDWVHKEKAERSWWENADKQHKIVSKHTRIWNGDKPCGLPPQAQPRDGKTTWMSLSKMKKLRLFKSNETIIHGLLLRKCLWMVKRRKDSTRSMLSMIEEPNIAQNHDDKLLTRTSTNDDIPKQQHHQWPRVFVNFAQISRWICQILFFQFVIFPHISTHSRLRVWLEVHLSPQRSSVYQISDVLPMVTTPSLMPTGPDAQQLLDTSSMSVVIVFVIVMQSTCVGCIAPSRKKPNVPSHT